MRATAQRDQVFPDFGHFVLPIIHAGFEYGGNALKSWMVCGVPVKSLLGSAVLICI